MRWAQNNALANVAFVLVGASLFCSPTMFRFFSDTIESLLGMLAGTVIVAAVLLSNRCSQDAVDSVVCASALTIIFVPAILIKQFGILPLSIDILAGTSLLLICAIDLWIRKSGGQRWI